MMNNRLRRTTLKSGKGFRYYHQPVGTSRWTRISVFKYVDIKAQNI